MSINSKLPIINFIKSEDSNTEAVTTHVRYYERAKAVIEINQENRQSRVIFTQFSYLSLQSCFEIINIV